MVRSSAETQGERKYTLAQLRGAYGAGWHAGRRIASESTGENEEVDSGWQKAMTTIAECVARRHEEYGESLAFIASAAQEAIDFGTRYYASEVILPLSRIRRCLQCGMADQSMTLRGFLLEFGLDHAEGISRTEEPACGKSAEALMHISALLWKDEANRKDEAERASDLDTQTGGVA